ncbi:F-box/LRR-repeat protein 12-like [Dunckerocampus dactyliophorus]|uniref:F-box/LRR-repeat protein 12-like n=1 Tax=Dunckerocampus dactyliophorus TaxID=161453 RepID=UPI00240596DD|nr:F-box/LRR-repeat protein 12-like [Dunckerocampus dactyliophorus]
MDEFTPCNLNYLPENILLDVLSYLSVRELVRAGRVCKRWRRLVRDQRLWRLVDLTAWKGMTSRILWALLRQYLGCGLRCLRLRGLLLSVRGGTFLSEAWLKALSTKCPRLSRLYLLHADLRSLPSCQLLPPSLKVLELRGCELPQDFFNQDLPTSSEEGAEATSSAKQKGSSGRSAPSGISIECLILNNVPSFKDQHLQSLTSWQRLSRLELCDTFRVTASGLRTCAAKDGACGVEGLFRLKYLEISITTRQGYQLQMASLGLGAGWLGLEELSLGGKEVGPGLLCASRLKDLKRLYLKACTLSEMQIVRSCRMLRGLSGLHRLEFLDVVFQPRLCPPEGRGGGEEEQEGEEEPAGGDTVNSESKPDELIPNLRRSLAILLPCCTLAFSNCSVQSNAD